MCYNSSVNEGIPISQELQRRRELRDNYLVPIFITWTSDVPVNEGNAALQGVVDAVEASGQRRDVVVTGSVPLEDPAKPYSSPDWYVQEAFKRQRVTRSEGFGPQVDVAEFLYLFEHEPYQENPHWEVFIVNNDLAIRDEVNHFPFVLGTTSTGLHASVESVSRLLKVYPESDLRYAVFRRVVRHEMGHMFGIPSRQLNVIGMHCANECTMSGPPSNFLDLAAISLKDERDQDFFCQDCKNDFALLQPKYKPLPQP